VDVKQDPIATPGGAIETGAQVGSCRRSHADLWRLAGFVLYAGLICGLLYAGFSHWFYDDPFISYRYADNLAHGLGFVYNPGERVQSTTTPLFVLMLALLGRIWPDLPSLAILLGTASLTAGALFIWDLSRTWKAPWVGWAGLLLYPSFSLLVATLSSEIPLYLCFCLGAFVGYARRRYPMVAIFAALAVLTRPDGILVALVLAVAYLVRAWRSRYRRLGAETLGAGSLPWLAGTLFVLLTVPWFLFAWRYFGSPLPVTLAAKQHQASMVASQGFTPGLITIAVDYAGGWPYWIEAFLALAGLAFVIWKARSWIPLLAWTALYFISFSLLEVSRYYWYYAPLVPGFVLAAGLGLAWFSGRHPGMSSQVSLPRSGRLFFNVRRIMGVLSLVFLVCVQGWQLWQIRQTPYPRYAIYRAVGEWLATHTPEDARVGTLETGIIGFYAHRPMLDFAGLLQPQVARQLTPHTTYEDAALWAVAQYQPDYIVLQPGIFPRLRASAVASGCVLVRQFDGLRYGGVPDMQIYACQPG
jgi:hypothetical protein